MASEILLPIGIEALTTPTANLYTLTSDTAIESAITLTEKSNAKGWYAGQNTGTETGLHRIQLKSGSTTIGYFWVILTNTSPTEDVAEDSPSAYGRLGAPAGASVSADVAAVKAQTAAIEVDTQDIQSRIPAALTADGNMKADALRWSGTAIVAASIPVGTAAGASGGLLISGSNSGTTTLGALVVSGVTTFTGAVTASSTVTVAGAVALSTTTLSSLTVSGTTSFATVGASDVTFDSLTLAINAIPWNTNWDAEVQSEVQDAIVANHLDHLLATAADGTECVNSTYIARLVSKSATPAFSSYTNTTDSLEALRDRGDAAWTTATGFSTHSASDVWSVGTRVLTAGTNIALAKGTGVTGFNDLSASDVRTAVGLASANLDTQLGDLPTNAELATALGTADDATLAAISSLSTVVSTTGVAIATATQQAIADQVLIRGASNAEGTASEHSLCGVILAMLESSRSGTTWTVRKTDGTTFATKTLSVDATAVPVVGVT